MQRVVATIDEWMHSVALGVQEYFTLGGRAARFVASRPFYWRDLLAQMDRIGVGSLPIILLTGTFTGMVLALQSAVELAKFGADIYVGALVGASMIRELGPVLAALMVTGRIGSGIASEIGSMRVTEQIDALISFGTDPIRKLVTPRVLAGLIMVPILTIITDVVGILGGLIIAVFKIGLPPDAYMRSVWSTIALSGFVFGFFPRDFVSGLAKPLVFGGIITLTGCYFGMTASGGTEGVGNATTRAVVVSSILILVTDYFLTQLLLVLVPPAV